MAPPQLSSCQIFGQFVQLTLVFIIAFFILLITVTRISPGDQPLREPSVSQPVLALDDAKTFTVAVFSDLHFGEKENSWGIDQDVNSTRVMRSVLENEPQVDLVVLSGDLITGENTFRENSSAYVEQIIQPILDRHRPWASIYGNHDSKFNLSREQLYKAEKVYNLCYTNQMGPSLPGLTNYYIIVYGLKGDPAAILWFFDSRGGSSYQNDPANIDDIPNWVAEETAAWFTETSAELKHKYGRALPSIAFVHVPPHVFLKAQQAGLDPKKFPGLNADVPLSIQGEGDNDVEFVNAILNTEGLHSIYVGHDHGDSWCTTWPGQSLGSKTAPFLCFAKHTGYGGYGTWKRGARIIKLAFSGGDGDDYMAVDTWVRMENGDAVTRVSLNDTYGLDEYPTDTGE